MARPPLSRTLLLAGLAVAGHVGRVLLQRRRLVAAVPPELRTPMLWLPTGVLTSAPARRLLAVLPLPSPNPPTDVDARPATASHAGSTVPVWVYRPSSGATSGTSSGGALLWVHGGGYVAGAAEHDHEACARFVRELGVVVVSVDYRLAPADPFPAALDDGATALRWLHAQADELGVDPARIAVGGESAGGGLAAALAQRAYDEDVDVAFQLLVYPMLDDRTVLRADQPETLVWTSPSNRSGWTAYLGHPVRTSEERPYAAPARREDLTGLAPAWIGVGDADLFHDEDLAYAARLVAAGVPCELEVVPGMYHGAYGLAPASSAIAQRFRQRSVEALRDGLLAG